MEYKSYGRRRSLRLRGYDYSSPRPIHIIIGTYRRSRVLHNRRLTQALITVILSLAAREGIRLYAYCFMPDHVHLLLTSERGTDVVRFVQAFKSLSTQVFWEHGGTGKLWQRGFYDHILRRDEDLRAVARYILENPVRKGLAEDFRDYPFSGSMVFTFRDDR